MAERDLQSYAERVNTGTMDAETSRALVVFNETDAPVSGVAVYFASMPWPLQELVPPVSVTDWGGVPVPCDMSDMAEGPDPKGRDTHRLLAFQLHFEVADVPAQGWKTYIASFSDAPPDPEGLSESAEGLAVTETTRHGGDLPSVGTF